MVFLKPFFSKLFWLFSLSLFPYNFWLNLSVSTKKSFQGFDWNGGKSINHLCRELTFLVCWSFQSMNGNVSIYLDLLWFFSSAFHSFQHKEPIYMCFVIFTIKYFILGGSYCKLYWCLILVSHCLLPVYLIIDCWFYILWSVKLTHKFKECFL